MENWRFGGGAASRREPDLGFTAASAAACTALDDGERDLNPIPSACRQLITRLLVEKHNSRARVKIAFDLDLAFAQKSAPIGTSPTDNALNVRTVSGAPDGSSPTFPAPYRPRAGDARIYDLHSGLAA